MMMRQPVLNIGVDVAKDAVVVACAEQSFPSQSVPNQRDRLRAWLKGLPAGSRIGLESTGAYHELLADLAHAQGHMRLRAYAPPTANQRKLDRLIRRRTKIVRLKAALKLSRAALLPNSRPSSANWRP